MIAEETFTILAQLTGNQLAASEIENMFLHLNAENAFAPNAMVTGLIEMLQLKYSNDIQPDKVSSVFSDILARDRHTGYYIHPALRTLYLDFALTRAALPTQEKRNFLILGDYLNLSSVNDAIGRSATNEVMATICGIYLDCMTSAGVVNWLYHRSMGDEITFVVVNTEEEKVKNGLAAAEKITDEFVQSLGLERLRHKKYPDQSGMGLVTAYVNLAHNLNHRGLKQQLDEAIQNRKKAKQPRTWFSLPRRGIEPDQYHNRSSEQRIDRALHKYRDYRTMAQSVSEAENQRIGLRNPLNPVKSLLIGRAIAWPRDDRIEYLRHHHNDSKVMLRADIYNLGGLNAVFGHDGADHIKAHLIRILYNTIMAHNIVEPKIFDCGGGIIDVVINAMPTMHLHKLIGTIQSNIYHQILSLTVNEYATAHNLSFAGTGDTRLIDLPHPRHENKGTGLVMATHPVESARSLPEIIERLDKITHRTKMHDFAYLWSDEDQQVFALPLNDVPETMHIGTDRKEAGPHYLPFTEALRHYLREDELPMIFEKPVGQICETLFGTDMQAVLGFKKAIRMLQDKKVDDDEIERLDSYEAMDGRLCAEGLPPLSVFSTQNRPIFAGNERESFRTMYLAEKLEDLPRTITSLILQAQGSFRTIKIVQPHGYLSPTQAIQVLSEEIARIHVPQLDRHQAGEQLTESMYNLARLLDRAAGALNRDLPERIRDILRDFSHEVLNDLAVAFSNVGETLLSKKLQAYVAHQEARTKDRLSMLQELRTEITSLLEKLDKKGLLHADERETLNNRLMGLLNVLHYHTQHSTITAEVAV